MKRKLAGFGLAFAVAELAGAYLPLSVLPLAAAFLLLGTAVRFVRRRSLPACLPVVLGLVLGGAWFAGYELLIAAPQRALAGREVSALAVVETDAEASFQEGMLRGTLRLTQIDGKPVDLRVYCTSFPGAEAGERFTARFTLAELPPDAYRLGRYADGTFLAAEYEGEYKAQAASRAPRFRLYALRMALSRRLRLYLPRELGGLEAAMLLGDKSQLTETAEETFRLAGVSHLLSISGLHFSLLCGLFLLGPLAASLRFNRPYLLFQALVLLFYMALTGFPVSVVRAGVIYLVTLLGYALCQPPDLLTSLGIAALCIGLSNGYAPCDIGCQLSFCGVLGVQLGAALGGWQRRHWLPDPYDENGEQRRLAWYEKLAAQALRVLETVETAALATCATLPALLAHGLAASGVSVLGNLLVVWMLTAALVLGLLVLLFSAAPFLLPCMRMASLLLAVWLKWMYALIGWCAALPAAHIYLPRRYTLLVLAVLMALGVLFWRRRRMLWYLPAAALCLAVGVGLGVQMQRDVIRVALTGTSGNACAVVSQNGRALVFFRGGAANWNAVERYLSENGAPELLGLVDLRQDPTQIDFPPGLACWGLEELPSGAASRTLPGGWAVDAWHDSGGNLAVLDAGGYHIAFTAGRAQTPAPVAVDLFCAGASLPDCVQPAAILTNASAARMADWQMQGTLYSGEEPVAVLRPGRSVIFEEARQIALQ